MLTDKQVRENLPFWLASGALEPPDKKVFWTTKRVAYLIGLIGALLIGLNLAVCIR